MNSLCIPPNPDCESPKHIITSAAQNDESTSLEMKKMGMREALASKLRAVFGNGDGFYVTGSGPVWVSIARSHEIPKLIAEHHRDQAKRDSRNPLIIGRR